MHKALYIGLMTGTSLDAADVAIINFHNKTPKIVAAKNYPIPTELKAQIKQLCLPGHNEIDLMGEVSVQLGQLYANAVTSLLAEQQISAHHIKAIGSHGQTIRHRPDARYPFTLQIGDPNIISAQTGITTVADFRRKDMALGGQGAPLTPAFHDALLKDRSESQWVLNIGGIANLSYLSKNKNAPILGFDTGPGNTLMDQWYQQHHDGAFDQNGEWAASGTVSQPLLDALKSEPYFKRAAPKSTGRELFNLIWLEQKLAACPHLSNQNVQATLLELTATSIATAVQTQKDAKTVWLCGGGTHNQALVARLKQLLSGLKIEDTSALGIHPDWIEAAAFAWLAKQALDGQAGNIPSVTGADKPAILGIICPP